jgi:hypothetical protein
MAELVRQLRGIRYDPVDGEQVASAISPRWAPLPRAPRALHLYHRLRSCFLMRRSQDACVLKTPSPGSTEDIGQDGRTRSRRIGLRGSYCPEAGDRLDKSAGCRGSSGSSILLACVAEGDIAHLTEAHAERPTEMG